MKTMNRLMIVLLLIIFGTPMASTAQEYVWPRERVINGNVLVTYQPQVDDWKDYRELQFRMAISFTPAGGKEVVGVLVLQGETEIDINNDVKTVFISNLRVRDSHFPSLDREHTAGMDQLVRSYVPPAVSISLAQLAASVQKKEAPTGVQLKNDPPLIFVSYSPAILLDVDGPPMLVKIKNTGLEYVANTHWRLFRETATSNYYLLVGNIWLTANELTGPWTGTNKLPRDMSKLARESMWSDLKKVIPPPSPRQQNVVVPKVFYSNIPAEIILFEGQPAYSRIEGTGLMYASNTRSYIFYYTPMNKYFYLTAGRWFSAGSLQGPWSFATPNLPADFGRIPPTSPAGQILASVPGTEEAKDAVLMAQVPTTVTVNASAAAANAKVEYNGQPQFIPIQGTSVSYAANTAQKVILVDGSYYLCLQGVWFVSMSPNGPWQTARMVPQQIYTIPPDSPVYNVTYVTQTVTPDGDIQASYTAGYMGAFILGAATGAVIAGGTGYSYSPAYIYSGAYPVYHPYPATYGAMPYHNSATGAYGVSQTAYGPYGSASRTASYNPYTGTYARTASASTAYGSTAVGQAYNPYTGASGSTRQSSNAYAQWGSSVMSKGGQTAYTQHYSTSQGTVASARTSAGGAAVGSSTVYGNTGAAKTASGNMYADHDGNAYKNTGSGWEKYDNGSWNNVQKPSQTSTMAQERPQSLSQPQRSATTSNQMDNLEREAQSRERGEQWGNRFQQMGSERGPGGGERGLGSSGRFRR